MRKAWVFGIVTILLMVSVRGSSYNWVRPLTVTAASSGSASVSDVWLNDTGDTGTGAFIFEAGAATDVPITIQEAAGQSNDWFQILEQGSGDECVAWRSNGNLIINANGNCAMSTSANYIRAYEPDAGYTGNFLLWETNAGVDQFNIDSDGALGFWGSFYLESSSGSLRLRKVGAGNGMMFALVNGDGNGANFVGVAGGDIDSFDMVGGASRDITMFEMAGSGERPKLNICGNAVGTKACLNISVATFQENSTTFEGTDYYRFEGNISALGFLYDSIGYTGDALSQISNMKNEPSLNEWDKIDHPSYGDAYVKTTIKKPIFEKTNQQVCKPIQYCQKDENQKEICEIKTECNMETTTQLIGYEPEEQKENIDLIKQVALLTRAVQQLTERIEHLENAK